MYYDSNLIILTLKYCIMEYYFDLQENPKYVYTLGNPV